LVVLTDGLEDVENAATQTSLRPRGVRDAAGDLVAISGREPVLDGLDLEDEFTFEHHAKLLVGVVVHWDARARIELEEVQHRSLAEKRAHANAGRELEPGPGREAGHTGHECLKLDVSDLAA
jgi:hypothetical protein